MTILTIYYYFMRNVVTTIVLKASDNCKMLYLLLSPFLPYKVNLSHLLCDRYFVMYFINIILVSNLFLV